MRERSFTGVLLYILFCSLLSSFTDDVSAVKKAATESIEIQHKQRPLCKETAFRIRTVITRVKPESDCDAECTVAFETLERRIGKGSASKDTCPKIVKQLKLTSRTNTPFWLDKCMSIRFHCLRKLPAGKVTTAELTEIPFFRDKGSKVNIISQYDGYNHCRCYATLKLWRVFRDDVAVLGDSQKTNCSNVEVCKRLTQKLSGAPGWDCVDETTTKALVSCTVSVVSFVKKDRHVCRACNKGATATRECEEVNWSEEAQTARAFEAARIDCQIEAQRRFDILRKETAQARESCAEKSLGQEAENIDTYGRLGRWKPSGATEIPSLTRFPQMGPLIPPNSGISFEEPILDFLDASSTLPDDFSDIDFSIFFPDVEPVSRPITNDSASLTSIATNSKHVGFDQGSAAGSENDIDLDELLPKRSRWERGESSNSAHDRSMSRTHTGDLAGSRNTISSQQSRTYASVTSSLNLLPASNHLQASGQTIQLDGSWLDIYRQLGPTDPIEPMPDLASLGSFQTNVISSVGYNAEQPDFEDLIEAGEPPSLDADADNELEEFFYGIV